MTTNVESQTTQGKEISLRTLSESFGKIFDEATSTDITFSVGEDGTEVKGHKLVLSTRSPVFYAMFNGGFEDKNTVDIQDANDQDFKDFLRFLYTDEIDLSSENVIGIFHLADKYNVPLLFDRCTQYLTENLNTENVCEVFAAAKKYNSEALTSTGLDFICLHAKDCLGTAGFLHLGNDDVKDISNCESLSCSEEHLFESLDEWSDEKCKEKELEVTDENKRTVLGALLTTIRFPLMEYEYLVNEISKRQICTESEVIQILQLHAANSKKESTLPKDDHNSKFSNIARKPFSYESVVLAYEGSYAVEITDNEEDLNDTSFMTNKDCWFYGIMIYGPVRVIRFCVEVILRDEFTSTEVVRESISLTALKGNYTCNVVLHAPVYLKRKRWYRCSFVVYTVSQSQFFCLDQKHIEEMTKTNTTSHGVLDYNATGDNERGVAHHDTFVEEAKRLLSPPTPEYSLMKMFRHKEIKVSERSNRLAGLLLF